MGVVIENNPATTKIKIVESGGTFATRLIRIVESEPTFIVSFKRFHDLFFCPDVNTNIALLLQADYIVASSSIDIAEAVENAGGKFLAKDISSGPVELNCHLAVGSNMLRSQTMLINLAASVKTGGFVLCVEDTYTQLSAAREVSLTEILELTVEDKVVYLLRKVSKALSVNKIILKKDHQRSSCF